MYFSAQFSPIKMYNYTQARAIARTCMNARRRVRRQLIAPSGTTRHQTLTARDNRLMSWHSEALSAGKDKVCECDRERERDRSGKKRLRLPAGKPVLISAGCQTHLLALFNIPIVKRDGLLLPLAS